MKVLFFVLGILACLTLVGCAGARFTTKGGWSSPVVYSLEEGQQAIYVGNQEGRLLALNTFGRLLWSFPDQTKGEAALGTVLYGSPAIGENQVYFGTYQGELYSVDRKTGYKSPEWDMNPIVIGEGIHVVGGPTFVDSKQCYSRLRGIVDGGMLLVGSSDGKIHAYCAVDGSLAWRVETLGEVWGSPVVQGDTVFVGSQDSNMYAISLSQGLLKWSRPFKTGGAIVSDPLVVGDKLFFGALDGKLYALNKENGISVWGQPFDAEDWLWSSPINEGENLYVVTVKGKVISLDVTTGRMRWSTDLKTMVVAAPVLVEKQGSKRLVVATKEGEIAVLRTSNGIEDGGRIPVSDGDNGEVKIKAGLGVSGSVIYINTMDPWTVQAVDLNLGGNSLWVCPPSCGQRGE